MSARLPTFYLSHGGGPWPYMTGEMRRLFAGLEASLKQLPATLETQPKAILVVSAHWEDESFAVMASPKPPMVYDYYGFPDYLYSIRYPAPGAPYLADRVHSLLQKAGIRSRVDSERGFDHGTYSLLAVTHPNADVPVMQVSIRFDYDPQAHLQLGRAIAPLRDEGVLVVASGSSYHNFHPRDARQESARFDAWLNQTLVDSSPTERVQRLVQWERAPSARDAHPREDHFIPLHVAVGAAEHEPGQLIYREESLMGGATLSSYQFG